MKRGAPDHHKMKQLARELKLPKRYALPLANGIMERLWHYTAKHYPQGDIGRAPDWAIAEACGWDCSKRADRIGQDSDKVVAFVTALVVAGWLDRDKRCRYLVHDWVEHADESVRKTLKNKHLEFLFPVNQEAPERTIPAAFPLPLPLPGRNGGAGLTSATSSGAPEPKREKAAPAQLIGNGFAPDSATDWATRYEGVYKLYPKPGWKPEGQMRYVEIISGSVDQQTAAAAIDRSVREWARFWEVNPGEFVPGIGNWFQDGYYLRIPTINPKSNGRSETATEEAIRFAREKREKEKNARAK